MRLLTFSVLGLALITGCGSAPVVSTQCTPGQALACTGAGGCSGGQACKDDGSGYLPCDCSVIPTEDSGTAPDTGSMADSGAGDSGGAKDSGPCVPKTCQALGAVCGNPPDGCGGKLNCNIASCDDGNDCTADSCDWNFTCTHIVLNSGQFCTANGGGTCHQGACCSGCWNGSSCQAGTAPSMCGAHGQMCQTCQITNGLDPQCVIPGCSLGGCFNDAVTKNKQACNYQNMGAGTGVCYVAACTLCGGFQQVCCANNTCKGNFTCQGGQTCQ